MALAEKLLNIIVFTYFLIFYYNGKQLKHCLYCFIDCKFNPLCLLECLDDLPSLL